MKRVSFKSRSRGFDLKLLDGFKIKGQIFFSSAPDAQQKQFTIKGPVCRMLKVSNGMKWNSKIKNIDLNIFRTIESLKNIQLLCFHALTTRIDISIKSALLHQVSTAALEAELLGVWSAARRQT